MPPNEIIYQHFILFKKILELEADEVGVHQHIIVIKSPVRKSFNYSVYKIERLFRKIGT